MASAEAARASFDVIKEHMPASDGLSKGTICVATVKGDIHDIGKTIVKMLLDNYGYHVIDLGRDVDPHVVLKTVQERHIRLVGLSALMTTTAVSYTHLGNGNTGDPPGSRGLAGTLRAWR